MQVIIRPEKDAVSELAAQIIEKRIRKHPHSVLGLATGGTMERLYALLVERHRKENLDFSLLRTYNLDEYIGIPAEHPNSYRSYMNKHLFSQVNIDLRNTYLPNGMAQNFRNECREYEKNIRLDGGVDLQLLGILEGGSKKASFWAIVLGVRAFSRVLDLRADSGSLKPMWPDFPMPKSCRSTPPSRRIFFSYSRHSFLKF